MTVLRAAYVKVRPDTDGFDSELKSRLRRIDASREGGRVGRTFGDGLSKGFTGGTFTRVAATMAAKMTIVGSAAAAAAPGVLHLTAALAPAAAAVNVLPAALLAGAAAAGTFKLATAGVGDAISQGLTGTAKQAETAMKGLPPAAQAFARSVVGLKTQLNGLRASVSQRFFLPLQDEITPLADLYLPLLRRRMSDLAGPLGGLGEQIAESARKAGAFRAVSELFTQTRQAVIGARFAVDPLVQGFSALIRATAPFLPGLVDQFAALTQRASGFIQQAAATGRIQQAFRGAMTTLSDLGGIAANVGGILRSVFSAANAGGNSLLAGLRNLTGQARDFLKSAQGYTALTATFATLGELGQALRTSLAAVLPAIAQSVRALAPAISGLAPVFAQLVVAVAPLLPYFSQIAAVALRTLTPALASIAGWLTQNLDVLKIVVPTVIAFIAAVKIVVVATKAWAAAQAILSAVMTANPIGIVIVAVAALVVGLIAAYKNSETFRRIVDGAFRGIAAAAKWAWETVIRPAVETMVSYFRNVIAPTVLWLWRSVIQPAWTGISTAVKVAWVVIQIALAAWRAYLVNVVFPVIRFLWNNVVKPVFAGIASTISVSWNKVIRPVFQALGTFIRDKVAPAFTAGVNAISAAWYKVRDAAKVPVSFVVNRVINPLVGGINKVASFVGVKDRIPTIAGFARGGRIPGAPSLRDNMLAAGPNGLLKVATGEFITNAKSTVANLPLVKAINAKQGRVTRDDVDPYLDGRARGGLIGDGIGDFFKKAINGAKGIWSAVTNPKAALTKAANAALGQIPGGGAMAGVVKGMGRRVIDGIGSWLSDKLGGGLGGSSVLGGWKGMQRLIAGRFPGLGLISGFRPGATTLSGNRSLHALGRAVDYPAVRALAAWIKSTFGAKTRELITPWQDLNLLGGRPHTYTGAIWNQHNFAGGNAHVHWAAARGGLVGARSGMPLFDNGGTLAPGVNTVYNGTGRPERLTPATGGNTYNINVNVPVGGHPAETGRQIVQQIKAFEASNGPVWKKP